MKYFWAVLGIISIALASAQVYRFYSNSQAVTNSEDSPLLQQPGPPPPPQDRYLQVMPNSPDYYPLPPGHPPEYYTLPQLYFYYEPCYPYFRPGISIFIGSGWWFTPGCGLINIGWYSPGLRPFPEHGVVIVGRNISNNHTTININRTNNISINNRPPAPPGPHHEEHHDSPHDEHHNSPSPHNPGHPHH
jgi:hypothetical protein